MKSEKYESIRFLVTGHEKKRCSGVSNVSYVVGKKIQKLQWVPLLVNLDNW